jgi:glycosyltransferase involved in cell wall biosynthesis
VIGAASPAEHRAMSAAEVLAPQPPPQGRAPVRVLHVYSGNLWGGIETFLRMVGRQTLNLPEVTTTEFALCFDGRLANELRTSGIRVHLLGEARLRLPRSIVRVRVALAKLLAARTYDVALCHSVWPHAIFAPVVRAAGVPLVHFMHDVPNRHSWPDLWAHATPPDLILCNSAFTLTAGRWLFGPVPRRLMIPWVDLDKFAVRRTSRSAIRASFGVGDDQVVILQASRMQESKGHRLLVDALAHIRSNPRWTCWITGRAQRPAEAVYEDELRRQVQRLGLSERIRFVGMYDDLPALMNATDVFCQPNVRPEPFGSAFVEALASGLPVVTTRMGGPVEIVTRACGRLVEPTPAAVGDALLSLVVDDDERGRLAQAGPRRAREIGEPRTRVNEMMTVVASVVPRMTESPVPDGGDTRAPGSLSWADRLRRGTDSVASVSWNRAVGAGPTRVLHVHAGNLHGGVETYLRTLAQSASLCPTLSMDFALCFERRLARELREAGARLHMVGPLRIRFPNRVVAARWKLARAMEETQYDVVVTHSVWSHALFGPVVRARGARLVYHMHDIPDLTSWLDRWASTVQPDAVLCYTRYLADAGRALFPGVPRHVVSPPSRLDRRGPAVGRDQVRASLGVGPGQIVILCASRLESWKGHPLLIQALAMIRDDPRWTCWIAGGPQRTSEIPYATSLRDQVARLGLSDRVQFLGQRSDMPDLFGAADIHCQPNTSPEPFGQAFVEALGAGLPVITTDMGGGREIVTPSCGALVRPDPASVGAALRALVNDDARRAALAGAAPARARELCDPEQRMTELAGVMAGLIQPGAPAGGGAASEDADPPMVAMAVEALAEANRTFDLIVEIGCGRGVLARRLAGVYRTYLGCDGLRDPAFPESASVCFRAIDVNRGPYPIEGASAEAVVAIGPLRELEDMGTLMREMARIVRPGGWVVVGAGRSAGRGMTASLLRRAALESGLADVDVRSNEPSRFPFVSAIWPAQAALRANFTGAAVMTARRP